MIELHPEILKKEGKQFVLLSHEEFEAIQELIADYEDLLELRSEVNREANSPTKTLNEVKKEFGL
jgi:PHD/YefM family antitoxin component YafN of YafNO toxin-antitoxin module